MLKSKHPDGYLQLEKRVTRELQVLWKHEIDPDIREMLRLEILHQRRFARDYWRAIGNLVPTHLHFS
jgi:hypothetical protein